jgi:hypothetical protein
MRRRAGRGEVGIQGSRRGAALLIATMALVAIAVIGGAFVRLGISTKLASSAALDQDRAFYLCEAATAEAGASLAAGHDGAIATQALPARFGNGLFWVTATNLGNGDYQLDACAMCNSGRASVRSVVHQVANSNANAALIGNANVTIASNVVVDSYDPSKGTYASQPKQTINGTSIVNPRGNVRSNALLGVSANDDFFGNVTPGPGNAVSGIKSSTYVYGNTNPASQTVVFPAVAVPAIASQGAKSVAKNDPPASRTLAAGSYHFTSLTIENQAAFTIQGPSTVVLDSFSSNPGCSLLVDATNGPVSIYFTGSASFVSNMTVSSNSSSAKNISMIFTPSTPVSLASNASLIGTIYAPNAAVSVSSNWVIYGAVMANTIDLASNVNIHYDESLGTTGRASFPTQSIASWYRRTLPVQQASKKRSDPFALMGIQKANCPYPANAWH